jgi:hypothetical protein
MRESTQVRQANWRGGSTSGEADMSHHENGGKLQEWKRPPLGQQDAEPVETQTLNEFVDFH